MYIKWEMQSNYMYMYKYKSILCLINAVERCWQLNVLAPQAGAFIAPTNIYFMEALPFVSLLTKQTGETLDCIALL